MGWYNLARQYNFIFFVCLSILVSIFSVEIDVALAIPSLSEKESLAYINEFRFETIQNAIEDMQVRFGDDYPNGPEYLSMLHDLRRKRTDFVDNYRNDPDRNTDELLQFAIRLKTFKRKVLLENPLLANQSILTIKRRNKIPGKLPSSDVFNRLGIPSNHECNSSLPKQGYDNEIALLSVNQESHSLRTIYRPEHSGYVGMMDLHWDNDRLLFTQSDTANWDILELRMNSNDIRQVSRFPDDVDAMDACYLPNEKILFGCTASYQSVPCWHGQKWVSNLYVMNENGGGVRQLCFDQDHNYHPSVLDSGQVIYTRWDYTGISHIFQRQLMLMNPDGTGQRAIYGSNSWFPNSLFFTRQIPGNPGQYISILSGYHGAHKMGQLVIIDANVGWHDDDGLVQRISGHGAPIQPKIADALIDKDWPKFLHPYPLDDTYFLVSCWTNANSNWGIYLADKFDNVTVIHEDPDYAFFEPVPIIKRQKPPVLPTRIDNNKDHGIVYLQNIHEGPGLDGVPQDTVTSLRILAYNFGYRHLAGPHKIGYGGPWEAMRIMGTVPLEEDGSAIFSVPANTPIALQPLDSQGRAVQVMRSWFTVMPGEIRSCVGCHESPNHLPSVKHTLASLRAPRSIEPWYGRPRGFDFAREVQPVLDLYCVSCHNGTRTTLPDLRPEDDVPDYMGLTISTLGVQRLHPTMAKATNGKVKYTPAYDALLPYVRRVGIEDDVSLLNPGEYCVDTSELIQMLEKGHHGVQLDREAWQRIFTWIDLNAPCHGTWGDVFPIPENSDVRRKELQSLYGGPPDDPEIIVGINPVTTKSLPRIPAKPRTFPEINDWPFDKKDTEEKQRTLDEQSKTVQFDQGFSIKFVKIPAGRFVMGGKTDFVSDDEHPHEVQIEKPFWISQFEITNQQFQMFDATHDSQYYAKRHARTDDQGLFLNENNQPVVRVSWDESLAFCDWLSKQAKLSITLPTEAQWEYACRAGRGGPLSYGCLESDFSPFENLADNNFAVGKQKNGLQITGGVEHLDLEGARLSETRFDDGYTVTSPVGSFLPNAFGLYDMHGNVSEWTLSKYKAYPYINNDGRNLISSGERRVVRGGSFFDRPKRSTSAYRSRYPQWRKVFNVGFRIVINE